MPTVVLMWQRSCILLISYKRELDLSYAYKHSQYALVEFHCYLKCIKILHDVSVLKGKLLFIQNNTGKEENEANTHYWENDHSLIFSCKTMEYFIGSKKRGYSWVCETVAFCLWETCRRIAWHTPGNTESGEFTKIHRLEESNLQAIWGLCEQFMHHTEFPLMRSVIFNFAELLSFLVAHKIVVGLAIDVFEILRNRVLQMVLSVAKYCAIKISLKQPEFHTIYF